MYKIVCPKCHWSGTEDNVHYGFEYDCGYSLTTAYCPDCEFPLYHVPEETPVDENVHLDGTL
jgi:hypothetical protein